MNKCKKTDVILALIFMLCFISLPLRADVFTFAPGKGGKAWGADLLGASRLWVEPAIINGIKSNIELALLRKDLTECYIILKNKFPDALFRFNAESLLIEIKRARGSIERIYLVNVGKGDFPVLQFSMEIPADMPRDPEWPAELPLPYSSSPQTVIDLGGRGLLYGAFTSTLSREQIYSEMNNRLISTGWNSLGKGVFMKESPMRMILVSASDGKNGKAHGFILKRAMKDR